jgi:hypothetical protein
LSRYLVVARARHHHFFLLRLGHDPADKAALAGADAASNQRGKMRTLTPLVGLFLFVMAGSASAEEKPTATPPDAPPSPPTASVPATDNVAAAPAPPRSGTSDSRRFEVGLAFLPMALGKFTFSPGGAPKTVDAAFAYGAGVSASYRVWKGLFVGVAPQYTFNVKDKTTSEVAKQLDLLARVAYAYRPVDTIAVYAEVLPGYSMIYPPAGFTAKGFVIAVGAGVAMDLSDRYFANIGGGYQIGYQNRPENGLTLETRTKYVRVTMGGGVRF